MPPSVAVSTHASVQSMGTNGSPVDELDSLPLLVSAVVELDSLELDVLELATSRVVDVSPVPSPATPASSPLHAAVTRTIRSTAIQAPTRWPVAPATT